MEDKTENQAPDPLQTAQQQIAELQTQLNAERQDRRNLQEMLQNGGFSAPKPETKPADPLDGLDLFNEDEITDSMSKEELASLMNKKLIHNNEVMISKALSKFEQEKFAPFAQEGLQHLSELRFNQVKPSLEFVEDFEPEVKEMLAKLPPNLRASPEGIQLAANQVIAQNIHKIIEKDRASQRQQLLDEGGLITSGSASRASVPEYLTPEGLRAAGIISNEAVKTINDHGGMEAFAKKASRGRKDWNTYARSLVRANGGALPEGD